MPVTDFEKAELKAALVDSLRASKAYWEIRLNRETITGYGGKVRFSSRAHAISSLNRTVRRKYMPWSLLANLRGFDEDEDVPDELIDDADEIGSLLLDELIRDQIIQFVEVQ